MKTNVSYANRVAPHFDAVEDIKDWLGSGEKFSELTQALTPIKAVDEFAILCSFAGIEGFPVIAWYELINGGGSWAKAAEGAR